MLKAALAAAPLAAGATAALAEPRHGIAMLGEPKYAAGFPHYDYADPAARKGGTLRQASFGGYDSLNPFIVKGKFPSSLSTNVFEALMSRSFDEPFSLYGLIAQSIDTPPGREWVEFELNPLAKFSDGTLITPKDVLFSWETLRDHGRPNHRNYYSKVATAAATAPNKVRFTFKPGTDREMALIMANMPVLPSHIYKADSFETPVVTALGSGPYVVAEAIPGRTLKYKKNPDYWAKDLNVAKGRFNFDELTYEYYQDQTAMFEAFKAGAHDFTEETDASKWLDAFNFPAITEGKVVKAEIPLALPSPTSALVFNTRRPVFADQRIRKAMNLLFDFEWMSKNLYRDAFTRLQSFFDRSSLSSHGQPASEAELALLKPFPDAVAPDVLAGQHANPKSDGQGWNRDNARAALALFKQAGFELKDGVLTGVATGAPFAFEVLAVSRSQERLLVEYANQLKRVGVAMTIKVTDDSQWQQRLTKYDYDMIYYTWFTSLSPGNEQTFRWGAKAADQDGSFNFAGVKSAAADAMIAALIDARDQAGLTAAVRALDRVLVSGDYVIPLYYPAKQWVAYRQGLRSPGVVSLYGYLLDTWWVGE